MGEYLVDFATYGWFPAVLPSEEAAEGEESSGDEEGSEAGGGSGQRDGQ